MWAAFQNREESENPLEFIRQMKREKVDISLAHAQRRLRRYKLTWLHLAQGQNHVVHLYNGMLPEILHRAPGVVGAVFDSKHND